MRSFGKAVVAEYLKFFCVTDTPPDVVLKLAPESDDGIGDEDPASLWGLPNFFGGLYYINFQGVNGRFSSNLT